MMIEIQVQSNRYIRGEMLKILPIDLLQKSRTELYPVVDPMSRMMHRVSLREEARATLPHAAAVAINYSRPPDRTMKMKMI